jgi:hypothetical protein
VLGSYWSKITESEGVWTLRVWVVRADGRHLAGEFDGSWAFVRRLLDLAPVCVAAWEGDEAACAQLIDALAVDSGVHLVAPPVSSNRSGSGEL